MSEQTAPRLWAFLQLHDEEDGNRVDRGRPVGFDATVRFLARPDEAIRAFDESGPEAASLSDGQLGRALHEGPFTVTVDVDAWLGHMGRSPRRLLTAREIASLRSTFGVTATDPSELTDEELFGEHRLVVGDEIPFPLTVLGVRHATAGGFFGKKEVGSLVGVRPVGDLNTYPGIMLGDLPRAGADVAYDRSNREPCVFTDTNPAMFVPTLNRVVWGYESWWYPIETEDQLKQISDEDIRSNPLITRLSQALKTEETKCEPGGGGVRDA